MMTNTGRRNNFSDGYYIRKQIGRRQVSKVSASFLFDSKNAHVKIRPKIYPLREGQRSVRL